MSCPNYKRICDRLVISNSVTVTGGSLAINIPENNYMNREKYCIVIAQSIPDTATITMPVVITIGEDTTNYPLVNCDCTNVTACSISTRTRYSVIVRTDLNGGSFVLKGRKSCSCCSEDNTFLPNQTTGG